MKLRYIGDPILSKPSFPITKFGDRYLTSLVRNMYKIMKENRGIGISAVQVGVLKQVMIVPNHNPYKKGDSITLINPEIIKVSENLTSFKEGCLSEPGVYREIERPVNTIISYYDVFGIHFTNILLEGIEARCFLHEFDHLQGITFDEREKKEDDSKA